MMKSRHPKPAVRIVLVLLMLALIGLPARTANAALRLTIPLADDGNADFVLGKFGLTGLVPPRAEAPLGGVQLLPLGTLERIRSGLPPLCQPLAEMGTAAYTTTVQGVQTTYFYVVGGRTTDFQPFRKTCHTVITGADGMTSNWTTDAPDLPLPVRENKAIALRTSSGGYLYSLGGISNSNGNDLSVPYIYRAAINESTGAISSWVTQTLQLPNNQGRHAFALTSFKTDDGSTYLYLFGGKRTYLSLRVFTDYKRDVWRAQIDSNGDFVGSWEQLTNVPVISTIQSCAGIYDAQAVSFPVFKETQTTTIVTETIFLIGGQYEGNADAGCNQAQVASADVYRASLDSTTGDLIWDSDPGQPPDSPDYNIFTLPYGLYGHKAVGFNQKIYVLGGYDPSKTDPDTGTPAPGPVRRVYGSFADESQDLVLDADTGSNFVPSDEIIPQALYAHGGEIGYYNNVPIFYIFGGRNTGSTSIGNDYVDTVYYAIPTLDESTTEGYAGQGVYFSSIIDLEAPSSPLTVTWTGIMTDSATDIELSYRIADTVQGLYNSSWTPLDGDPSSPRWSKTGPVTVTNSAASSGSGQYFQYRALLRTTDGSKTPILTQVSLVVEYNAFPDLWVTGASFTDLVQGPFITLTNAQSPGSSTPLLDANIDGSDGTFFVDLYAFPPGTEVQTPTLGVNGADPLGIAYAQVPKASLPVDATYTIPPGNWRYTETDQPVNWSAIFNQTGEWTILIVVDSYGYSNLGGAGLVPEGSTVNDPGEQNNIFRFTFTMQNSPVYLPFVAR